MNVEIFVSVTGDLFYTSIYLSAVSIDRTVEMKEEETNLVDMNLLTYFHTPFLILT